MQHHRRQISRASLLAALGLTAVPVVGATITLADDRAPIVVESAAAPAPLSAPALTSFATPTANDGGSDTLDADLLIDRALDAYFGAGYDYDLAVDLAEYWGTPTPYDAKILKGKFILGLIDFPEPIEVPPVVVDEEYEQIVDRALEAYFGAGYDYDQAVWLAEYWGTPTPYDAKILKGKFILGLIDFPEPAIEVPSDAEIRETFTALSADDANAARAIDAYLETGYDYDHAVGLAEYWGMSSPVDAKILKGLFILDQIEFPNEGTFDQAPATVDDIDDDSGDDIDDAEIDRIDDDANLVDQALDAYFGAGYDYDHAVALADFWGVPTPYDAKILKGEVILGLIDFPESAELATEDVECDDTSEDCDI